MARKILNILITAGPTVEPIDPVRFLSNRSSGKMGYALASEAQKLGHRVVIISGPTALPVPSGCQFATIKTAKEMLAALKLHFPKCDVLFMAAAVADYRPRSIKAQKIKKTTSDLTLKLIKNPDLLKIMAKQKRVNQTVVGFAAETQNGIQNAQKKMHAKKLDWIILNDVSRADIGFESDANEVILLSSQNEMLKISKQSKKRVAQNILKTVLKA